VHAKLLISAASADQFPRTGLPEVAMVGRSNVGKSSLINALVKRQIARTSAAPGKTRLANYYLVGSGRRAAGSEMYLVDLPGYGYARGGAESVEAFGQLTRQYFDLAPGSGRRVGGVMHLIDARHPDLPQDAAAFAWLMRTQLPIAIVATKIDKLKRSDQQKAVSVLERKYGVIVLPESASSGAGLEEIWKVLRTWTPGPQPGA
jgi:GTP-binding protein